MLTLTIYWLMAIAGSLLLAALKYHYSFWQRQGMPQIRPLFGLGNMWNLMNLKHGPAEFIRRLYEHKEAKDKRIVGIFTFYKPALLVRDPLLIKQILTKDFAMFNNRYSNTDSKGDPMGSQNLFFLKNPDWREVRWRLSPFFSGARLKKMFALINEVGCNLDAHLNQHSASCRNSSFSLELKDFCALYTTDVIASVAFGIEANSFTNPNGEFRRNGREIFTFHFKRSLEFILVFFLPHLVPYFGFKVVPAQPTEFLRSTIQYVMKERELSGCKRNDLIDILIDFKNSEKSALASAGVKVTDDLLVAQAAIFFTGGFESSSSTMSFALYELAKHQHIQQRLRNEIKAALAKTNGLITYHMIESLQYMQMVIDEVLRLFPSISFLDRECTSETGYSLKPTYSYEIPKGMGLYIPIFGLHRDAKYFPNPDAFDPERFSPSNKANIVPYTYLPFGTGPHGCIGQRLAFLQSKIGLVHFLRNHIVTTGPQTCIPVRLDPKAMITAVDGGVHVNVVKKPL